MSCATAKELAYTRRRECAGADGIDGIDMDNFAANEGPYETTTIVARDGVHIWNTQDRELSASIDMNDIVAPPADPLQEYLPFLAAANREHEPHVHSDPDDTDEADADPIDPLGHFQPLQHALEHTADADGNEIFIIDLQPATPAAQAEMQAGRVH